MKHPRFVLFLAALVAATALLLAFLPTSVALIAGFDTAVLVFVLSCIPLWRHGGPETMRRQAERDDAGGPLLLLMTVLICVVILTALTDLMLKKSSLTAADIANLVATLVSAWVFANLIFALHYARMFWTDKNGTGLDFPGDEPPGFADFVNFAFVVGMTCQTADVAITQSSIRRVTTWHGLFAFAFNLGILALTVNVLAGS